MSITIDELYEAYMDKESSFGEDVFDFLGYKEDEDWARQYGKYLPSWDPSTVRLAERERDIDYERAMDTLDITQKVADRVYAAELDTLSTELGREMSKGRDVAGRLGLKSGSLESAVDDSLQEAGEKTKNLGDRLMLSEEETLNSYNKAVVNAALDFDRTERQEKEDFFDRTMAALDRLRGLGAFEGLHRATGRRGRGRKRDRPYRSARGR